MIPAQFDLPTWRNADYIEEIQFTVLNTPVNITGVIFNLGVRYSSDSSDVIALTTVGGPSEGVYIVDAVNGTISIKIDNETLSSVYASARASYPTAERIRFIYDLIATWPDGLIEIWAQGLLTINAGVSNG